MIWTYLLLVISILVCVSVTVWLILMKLKEKDIPEDNDIILNFCSHLDGSGRFLLSQKTIDSTSYNDRAIYTGIPRDIDYKKLRKENGKIEEVNIIATPDTVISCTKGSPSKDKNIKFILPPNAEDFPTWTKDTVFGKILMNMVEGKNIDKDLLGIVKKGSNLKTQYLSKLGDGEISEELVQQFENLFKQMKELLERKNTNIDLGIHERR